MGWISATDELPPVGQRVDVKHVEAPGYDCDGEVDDKGVWHCRNGFITPGGRCGMFTFTPTHWRPRQPTGPAQ